MNEIERNLVLRMGLYSECGIIAEAILATGLALAERPGSTQEELLEFWKLYGEFLVIVINPSEERINGIADRITTLMEKIEKVPGTDLMNTYFTKLKLRG